MKAIIDTSSLKALVTYYLPFDAILHVFEVLERMVADHELIIIDEVYEEAQYISKGIILEKLPFINEKNKVKTQHIIPNKQFYHYLENDFCDKSIRKAKNIDQIAFEIEKSKYLKSADCRILLYALKISDQNPIIVTEETSNTNDNKLFKKIPVNCSTLSLICCNLPDFLKKIGIKLA